MSWIKALKKWNDLRKEKGKGAYCIPRRGSNEYNQVQKIREIMEREEGNIKIEKPKSKPKQTPKPKPKRRIIRRNKKDDNNITLESIKNELEQKELKKKDISTTINAIERIKDIIKDGTSVPASEGARARTAQRTIENKLKTLKNPEDAENIFKKIKAYITGKSQKEE